MINESKTPATQSGTNVEKAVKDASKGPLNRMLSTIEQWKEKLKKSSKITAKNKATRAKAQTEVNTFETTDSTHTNGMKT